MNIIYFGMRPETLKKVRGGSQLNAVPNPTIPPLQFLAALAALLPTYGTY